ncbi:MAG: RnfABCDGE type electron transport complex subunit B [Clostridiales bacterium]|jgi:RnfABCDGE-type electron transport complex B subunit|nr:RnfABCDGE type electron transport complex subunit B [Clostridiales bacterium]
MNEILNPVLLVAGIGLLAGLILAVVSIVMAVPKDEKAEAIRAMLPGANCGACGFSGCDGYAKALSSGEAKPGLCPVGGAAVTKSISEYLGCDAGETETKVAVVHCLGSYDFTSDKVNYEGIRTCAGAAIVAGGVASCQYGCMGLGDCMRACEYGAITVSNGLAVIDPKLCRGCSKCIQACPKHLIHFVPFWQQAVVLCSNCDKGADTNRICKTGCIACKKCERTCRFDAIHVVDNHAVVDTAKCTGCGECAKACPRHCIKMLADM